MKINFKYLPAPPNLHYPNTLEGRTYESDGQFFIRCKTCMVRLSDGALFISSYYTDGNGRGKNFQEVQAEITIVRQKEPDGY